MKITRLDTPHCSVGEGPVWDVQEQALYSIDILGKCIHRHHLASGRNDRFEVPGIIGSMALRVGGGALIALKDGVHTYDFATGASAPLTCALTLQPLILQPCHLAEFACGGVSSPASLRALSGSCLAVRIAQLPKLHQRRAPAVPVCAGTVPPPAGAAPAEPPSEEKEK